MKRCFSSHFVGRIFVGVTLVISGGWGAARADVALNESVTLALPTNDVVYDSTSGKLYASVTSEGGTRANSLVSIDPTTGQIGQPMFVGLGPGKLALAQGGKSLYVAIENASSVVRFDHTTRQILKTWALGSSQGSGPLYVEDMEAMPERDETVAISLRNQGYSPKHEGVAIYDNGVKRPTQTQDHTGANVIEFADANTIYGFNNESSEYGLRRIAVAESGLSETENHELFTSFTNDIRYAEGLIFDDTGKIVTADTLLFKGRFKNAKGVPVAKNNRAFYCADGFLRAYDLTTFRSFGAMAVPSGPGLVAWGEDGFAWRGAAGLVIARSDLVTRPLPAPASIAPPSVLRAGLRVWDVPANDLIYDPQSGQLFASVPSDFAGGGNSVIPLDPFAGVAGAPIFVGSEPNRLALSTDSSVLYAALDGSGEVRRVDLASGTANLLFNLGRGQFDYPLSVEDIAAVPGKPNAVAISRRNQSYSPKHEGVAIYDNGVKLPKATANHTGANVIEFADASTLLGGTNESSEFGLRTLLVDDTGVVQQSVMRSVFSTYNFDFRYANGRIYATNGQVISASGGQTVATLKKGLVCVDAALNRVFIFSFESFNVSKPTLFIYQMDSLQLLGSLEFPEITGVPAALVRWGSSGLALRTQPNFQNQGGSKIFLIENEMVAPKPILSLKMTATTFSENAGSKAALARVTRGGSLAAALTVQLASSSPALGVPASVIIPAGARSVLFDVDIIDDTVISGARNVTLTASATGFQAAQIPVRINDNEAILTLSVSPGIFGENADSRAATATISRGAALATPLRVSLTSSDTNAARVPINVTIPAGASQITFPIAAVNNTTFDGTRRATIVARAYNWRTAGFTVRVTDDETAPPPVSAPSSSAGAS